MNFRKLLERLYPWPSKLVGIIGLLLFLIACGIGYGVISLVKIFMGWLTL